MSKPSMTFPKTESGAGRAAAASAAEKRAGAKVAGGALGALQVAAVRRTVVVEVRVLGVGDEELRSVRVGPAVGHRDDAPHGVLLVGVDLVVELAPPDALAALARARGVAALQHEALDVAVEERVVVVARRGEREKVEGCARHDVAVDLELERAEVRVQRHRHGAVEGGGGDDESGGARGSRRGEQGKEQRLASFSDKVMVYQYDLSKVWFIAQQFQTWTDKLRLCASIGPGSGSHPRFLGKKNMCACGARGAARARPFSLSLLFHSLFFSTS